MAAWSFSRLKNFESCPKKFWHLMVRKDVRQDENDTLRYGKEVHKALEDRVKKDKRLPMHLTHLEKVAKNFASPPHKTDEILTEQQLAITKGMEPTGWFDKDVWVRSIIDYLAITGDKALLVDYKTGKMYDDFTQLKLAAAMLMLHRPDINTVTVVYWWIKDKKLTKDYLCREDMAEIWNELLPRVKRYDEAHTADEFPAKSGYLCRNWCPVKQCKFNGE